MMFAMVACSLGAAPTALYQSICFWGSLYDSACSTRSASSFGKTASNSLRVVLCAMAAEGYWVRSLWWTTSMISRRDSFVLRLFRLVRKRGMWMYVRSFMLTPSKYVGRYG